MIGRHESARSRAEAYFSGRLGTYQYLDMHEQCDRPIQERMVWHLFMCEDELGRRVGEGLGVSADDVRGLPPLQTQTLTEAELERAVPPRRFFPVIKTSKRSPPRAFRALDHRF